MDELAKIEPEGIKAIKSVSLMEIEAKMLACDQVEIPLTHVFSGGVCIRQIEVPAGTLIMGKRHRYECCNMLLKGKMLVYVEEDNPPIEVVAPSIFTSPPYAKKFALCTEDTIFVNVLPTKETNPDEIEKFWIIPEQEYLEMIKEKP
jgi:hypothetical protein